MGLVITPPVEEAAGRYSLPLGMGTHVPIITNNNNNLDEALGWGWIGLCMVLPRRRGCIGMTGSIRARRRMVVGTRAGLTFCRRPVGRRARILLYLGSVEGGG